MKLVLSDHPEINRLFYFHFDAWIDPTGWANQNYHNIWYPSVSVSSRDAQFGPPFMCISDTSYHEWWGWGKNFHKDALAAISNEL